MNTHESTLASRRAFLSDIRQIGDITIVVDHNVDALYIEQQESVVIVPLDDLWTPANMLTSMAAAHGGVPSTV